MTTTAPDAIELTSPDGRVFAYACPRCLEVRADISGGGVGEQGRINRAEHSKADAEQCCLCRGCGTVNRYGILCPACRKAETEKFEKSPQRLEYQRQLEASQATFDLALNTAAARLLARLMSDISEECWCAGWMSGTEHALWKAVQTGEDSWGQGEIGAAEIAQLRMLSEQSGGWIVYGDGGEEFVPLADWTTRYVAATGAGSRE